MRWLNRVICSKYCLLMTSTARTDEKSSVNQSSVISSALPRRQQHISLHSTRTAISIRFPCITAPQDAPSALASSAARFILVDGK